MRELAGDFGEFWEAIAGGSAAQRMRGNVKALEIFAAGRDFLEDADVLTEILQVLRGFLEEQLDGFAVGDGQDAPSMTSSDLRSSSAVGLRYRMQSLRTMA